MRLGIDGLEVGHHTDRVGATGVTVVVLPEGAVAAGEVRGGAPATRDVALLAPERLVDGVDAVVLAGGSVFGLAAVDGVVAALEEQGRGLATPAGRVPIVVGLGLYDLAVGDPTARPGPAEGRAAFEAATADPATGRVGAGTGARVGAWRGPAAVRPGGLGIARVAAGPTVVAVVAVNAAGEPDDGLLDRLVDGAEPWPDPTTVFGSQRTNTTIGVVVTDASLDATGCLLVAQSAHDGLGRALVPAHTRVDGDAFVAVATGRRRAGSGPAGELDRVRVLAVAAVERAVRSAVAGR